jgi:non-ribosomal peptide synthetase component F
VAAINSQRAVGVCAGQDVVVQIVLCSFDAHIQDICGTLLIGGTVVLLRPNGNLDFEYLFNVLTNKHVTLMLLVPSLVNSFCKFLEYNNSSLKTMRSLCCVGQSQQCTVF